MKSCPCHNQTFLGTLEESIIDLVVKLNVKPTAFEEEDSSPNWKLNATSISLPLKTMNTPPPPWDPFLGFLISQPHTLIIMPHWHHHSIHMATSKHSRSRIHPSMVSLNLRLLHGLILWPSKLLLTNHYWLCSLNDRGDSGHNKVVLSFWVYPINVVSPLAC